MSYSVPGGPSDDKDARIKALEAENAALKQQTAATMTGQQASKAARLAREAECERIFGSRVRRR